MYSAVVKMKDLVKRLLETDNRTQWNDFLLQMRVLTRKGFAKRYDHSSQGAGWFIRENDIISGKIPPSIMETIRRSRQKEQEIHPELKPRLEKQVERIEAEKSMRENIHNYDRSQTVLIEKEET